MPLHRLPCILAHPAADLGITLVGSFGIGIVVELWIPTLGVYVRDAVAALFYVFPKCADIGCIGKNGARPDNRDGAMRGTFHNGDSWEKKLWVRRAVI